MSLCEGLHAACFVRKTERGGALERLKAQDEAGVDVHQVEIDATSPAEYEIIVARLLQEGKICRTSLLRSLLELVLGSARRSSAASPRPTRSRCSRATRII